MAKAICTVPECERDARARTWCKMHYKRWWKFGDPLATTFIRCDDAARIWSWVDKRGPDECWPWRGGLTQGYGATHMGPVGMNAHRAVYILTFGDPGADKEIDHVWARGCTRRDCCNPAHLEAVVRRVNQHRSNSVSGRNHRKTHCLRGHAFDEANTYVYVGKRGTERGCRTCRSENKRRRNAA